MTPEERAELRRLAEAASPERSSERIEVWRTGARSGAMREEDGAFYVAARTAVPALLDEVERLERERDALRAWASRAQEALALTMIAMPADCSYACVVRATEAAAAVLADAPEEKP